MTSAIEQIDKKILAAAATGVLISIVKGNQDPKQLFIAGGKAALTAYVGKWLNARTGQFGTTVNGEILATTIAGAIAAGITRNNILTGVEEAALFSSISELLQHKLGIGY